MYNITEILMNKKYPKDVYEYRGVHFDRLSLVFRFYLLLFSFVEVFMQKQGDEKPAHGGGHTQFALLTVEDLARTLRYSVRHIRRLNTEHKIPAPHRIGRSLRWTPAEIYAWIDAVRTWVDLRRSA